MLIESALVKPVVSSLGADASEYYLALWHGFNTVLLLSAITIAVGVLLYFFLKPSAKLETRIGKLEFISPKSIMEKGTHYFSVFSAFWTNVFQNGYLRNYVTTIVLFLVVLVGYVMFGNPRVMIDHTQLSKVTAYELAVVIILIAGVFYTIFTKSRLAAVAAMGVVGLAICLIFVFYSAPDLAMTQFSIDTLTVILFVLVLYRLPKYLTLSDYKMRIRDGVLSLALGTVICLLALQVLAEPTNTEVGDFYAKNAYILAKGKNVVNVILVDFRGTDTLMEIAVLSISAIGVFGLLKLRLKSTDRSQ
jgi:multicomponent Na+:H+ antiporter subunit A